MSQETSLKQLLQELAEERALDLRGYKITTIERRIRKRMFQLSLGSFSAYAEYIRQKPDEINELLNVILINVTEFFRDPPAWEILRNEILPPILQKLKPGEPFRVWSAGCATGQEAYSLAITLSELLGPRLPQFDVKIYATDVDEPALGVARRAEYPAEALRHLRPSWREKYFYGKSTLRVSRDIRRLVIFGHSNLAKDAPISHVSLLACRNVLIYFGSELQRYILGRMDYALDPGGILFLGKAESQLSSSTSFQRLNARWRIFQKIGPESEKAVPAPPPQPIGGEIVAAERQLENLRSEQRKTLEALGLGIIVITPDGTVTQSNSAVLEMHGLPESPMVGEKLQDTSLFAQSPDLSAHMLAGRDSHAISRYRTKVRIGEADHVLEVTLRPVAEDGAEPGGSMIAYRDVTAESKLQLAIGGLESTSAELQSANEELETTNEELQSTNEELETTNEELQSTNEELETTNEELQSLNEELQTTNQELEEQTRQVEQINSFYEQALERIPLPVMLVTHENQIEFWNSMALRLFGFKSRPSVELDLGQLPVEHSARQQIVQRVRATLIKRKPVALRDFTLRDGVPRTADISFSMVEREGRPPTVLLVFRPPNSQGSGKGSSRRRSAAAGKKKPPRKKN